VLENNVAVCPWPIHFCLRLKKKNGLASEAGQCEEGKRQNWKKKQV